MPFRPALITLLLLPLLGKGAETTPAPTAAQIEFFEKEVRPVLADNCFKCHGPKKQKSGLRLDSRELILKGGEVGAAVVAGKPELSRLILAINHAKAKDVEPMPSADEKISDKAIAALTEWVRMGLPWPAESSPVANDPRNHWAFQPVKNPPLPSIKNTAAARQPLDRFVLAKLEANGLQASPEANRETLARRFTLALWGVNPSAPEVTAFVADKDPAAAEKFVDRLMADPAFGERWGRHWLDVARYSDTKGYVFQEERRYPYAYTYRDWVVNAFNKDLPYDQFLRLQLAADKIVQGEDNRDLAALGYVTLGRRFINNQQDIIDDRIDVVMRGTQALTMACARCHDHKFDPLPTTEYYSLYSIFNSSEEPKELPALKPFTRTKETAEFETELGALQKKYDEFVTSRRELSFSAAKTADYLTLVLRSIKEPNFNFTQEAKRTNLYPTVLTGWQRILKAKLNDKDPVWGGWYQLRDVADDKFVGALAAQLAQPESLKDPLLRAEIQKKAPKKFSELTACLAATLAEAHKPEKDALTEWKSWRALIEAPNGPTAVTADSLIPGYNIADRNTRTKLETEVMAFKATSPKSPPHAMALQDKAKPAQGVVFLRGSPSRPGKNVARQFLAILSDGPPKEFKEGSGRLELANAIASKTNPLTARVMVNRVWTELIGVPLVETPSDFGVRTAASKNPELLDHLATTFMADDWSMKKLIRTIVLSSTFRQSSELNPTGVAKDPDNLLAWRANRRRLDFEAMRDSILRVAGNLEMKTGGQPFDLVANFSTPRRTIYSFIDRQNLPAVFRTFDFANPDYHVPKRNQTTTPQQALWMLNHPFARTQADALASKVTTLTNDEAKVAALYTAVLSRRPTSTETQLAVQYIREAGQAPAPATWTYGVGGWDPATKQLKFTEMKFKIKEGFGPGEKMPNKEFGHAFLSAAGGHPGDRQDTAVVRRWTAGGGGKFRIESKLEVPSKSSDGVRGRITSSRAGLLLEAVAKGAGAATLNLEEIELAPGESINFVADNLIGSNSDGFKWSAVIKDAKSGEVIASGAADFGKKTDPQSAWSTFAQVLLESNEFIFAD